MIDWLMRAQTLTRRPLARTRAVHYLPTDSTAGTEVYWCSCARVNYAASGELGPARNRLVVRPHCRVALRSTTVRVNVITFPAATADWVHNCFGWRPRRAARYVDLSLRGTDGVSKHHQWFDEEPCGGGN